VTLTRSELDQQPGTPARALARRNPDLHFAFHNHEPGALVHLVVGQALADHEVEHDRARGIARGEDLRLPRLEIKRPVVPARPLRTPAHRDCPFVGRQCTGAVALGLIGPVPQLPSGSLHGRTGRWWTVAPAAGLSGAGCGLKRGAYGWVSTSFSVPQTGQTSRKQQAEQLLDRVVARRGVVQVVAGHGPERHEAPRRSEEAGGASPCRPGPRGAPPAPVLSGHVEEGMVDSIETIDWRSQR
jgi:hypothetical protein